ncbi:DUF427 domain-containing protein [Roseococcus suduntuyensis]|uniref:Uncharacterized protein (DUF427 family) n=1 Tax=Roseococcus suduntuyensis TaxID=455361 RepID=A0A840ACI1_9PROT|nr:DUF427 domain-containing protein [Roseococcus suduntuyensis]MBB3899658.1 uncharacterized protein (DUF427 family) [Roseococcus suduntuyensis]
MPARERAPDYPRPPRLEPSTRRVRVILGGEVIVDSRECWRVLETWHPPSWYIPASAFAPGALRPAQGSSFCEWKGSARYLDLLGGGQVAARAAWSYPDPTPEFAPIAGHVALYAGRVDACLVDEDRVEPQPGGFYGGWITPDVEGPFKGAPGTRGW